MKELMKLNLMIKVLEKKLHNLKLKRDRVLLNGLNQ